jgi:serine/threonine-protein kinase
MALAIEASGAFAAPSKVGAWVEGIAGGELATRARSITEIEQIQDLPIAEHSSRPPRILVASDEPTTVEPGMGTPPVDQRGRAVGAEDLTAPDFKPDRRRRIAMALAFGLLLLGVLLWASFGGSDSDTRHTGSPVPRAAASGQAAVDLGGTQGQNAATEAPSAPEQTASADPTAAGPLASAPGEASARAKPVPTGRSKGRPASKASCNPPYTIDQEGHRRYKMECL